MLGRHLPCSVLEPPRRIRHHRFERLARQSFQFLGGLFCEFFGHVGAASMAKKDPPSSPEQTRRRKGEATRKPLVATFQRFQHVPEAAPTFSRPEDSESLGGQGQRNQRLEGPAVRKDGDQREYEAAEMNATRAKRAL